MSCLGLKIFGYNESIEKVVKEFDSIITTKLEIVCHSQAWNYEKKVAAFVITLLAALLIATGGALYAAGVINSKTAMGLMYVGGGGLVVNLAFVFAFLRKHMFFVETVGENMSGKMEHNRPLVLWLMLLTPGVTTNRTIHADTSQLYDKVLITLVKANSARIEYFETFNLYKASEDSYFNKKTLVT